ncbi:MAG: adenosylcobinamide amidohydrolase, partial [Desulfobacteraceae bacterium]
YNNIQKGVVDKFSGSNVILIDLETISIEKSFNYIELLGEIFNRQKEAKNIVLENKEYIELVKKKIVLIPEGKRKRVMRLMGRDKIMTPGDDSFQKEFVELAGGIVPVFNKDGSVIPISKNEFIKFNPQAIYCCGNDKKLGDKLLKDPEYRDIDAIKNYEVYYFPCDLTCRAATNIGYFVMWLSARINSDEFAKEENLVLPEKVVDSKDLDVKLDYVTECRIDYTNIFDFFNKSLIVEFDRPVSVISTLEGPRENIKTVGNHYSPNALWSVLHDGGVEGLRKKIYKILDKSEKHTSFLFTGADVDNVAVINEKYKEMSVYALVTAGVTSNAIRTSIDDGAFYEPGTINIVLLPNMKLTKRAMTRAIITATEAKSAALQDLDIRSSYSPGYQATGTGTDNMIIAEGSGDIVLDNSGGHTKFGELIAKAVYKGVKEAIYKQNGIVQNRNIFQRLKERNITISDDISPIECDCGIKKGFFSGRVERILNIPQYASFISSALAISDDYENGLVTDLTGFKAWCYDVAYDISGQKFSKMEDFLDNEKIPVVIRMALNALLNGIYQRELRNSE